MNRARSAALRHLHRRSPVLPSSAACIPVRYLLANVSHAAFRRLVQNPCRHIPPVAVTWEQCMLNLLAEHQLDVGDGEPGSGGGAGLVGRDALLVGCWFPGCTNVTGASEAALKLRRCEG